MASSLMACPILAKPHQNVFGKLHGMVPARPVRAREAVKVRAASEQVWHRLAVSALSASETCGTLPKGFREVVALSRELPLRNGVARE